ncbi:hypothetical protein F3Y22_tig00110223pilonHSYRG00174 [Hibiscus syriacus]|uniref:MULE transposase domain-containing protein n=1 Tax=Hibiscus syriacus TaxID=106335 RepID=A0A6A3B901_HIBSY|nr:hypothetical protein F3Y22_tig00110223pilonHSYRG00174 [Hibiscus syriacus]
MDHTDADNVKPTEKCHEVHNVDESDRLVGQLFCSRDQAWYFYKGFPREHGFSARKGTTRLDVEGNVKTQEFFCSKEGAISKADIDEVTTLKEVDVGTSQVMNYLTQQTGGYHNVVFTHKDLYNALQRGKEKEIVDGDVNALIAYFDYKKHVVTDGDRAMQRAIKSVIPYDKHILCFWHLSRNAQANIGDPKFTAVFSKCMASWWTTEEFDIQWCSVVSEFNVEKHPWVIEKGNKRHLWAQAYLTGHFFANIRSTQRCEPMNASLAIALKHKKIYLDVVRAIEGGISRMRMNELKAYYLSSHMKPFHITKLFDLESHTAAIFTRESFRAFQDELLQKTLWTNDAKASAPSYVDLNVSPEVMQMARFAALRSTSSRLCYITSKTDESFKTARDEMKRIIEELENSFGLNDSVNQNIIVNNVRDPQQKQLKRKEVPKNKVEKIIRRCGYCNGEGHNKLTCPQVKLSLSIM